MVVSGEGLVRFRKIDEDKIIEYRVSGDKLQVVDIPTGYTYSIVNVGKTDFATLMWVNEPFNPDKPDTYFLKEDIENSDILERLKRKEGQYFVVSAHREENISSEVNFLDLIDSLNAVAEKYNIPIIISTHPRTKNMIEAKGIEFNKLIKTMKPLGFNDYIKPKKNSKAVLSDSGTISEESPILRFKALNIRQAHERPEAMEEVSVMMVGLKKERTLQGLEVLEIQEKDTLRLVGDYNMPNVSDKVLRIILSYTDYVNRVVWGK